MVLLYVDEDQSREFVELLRARGHDVAYPPETGAAGRTDAWHRQRASVEQRVLITFNDRDLRFLHRLWTSLRVVHAVGTRHAGILTSTAQLAPSSWLPAVSELLASGLPLAGRMLIWRPSPAEWREDD